MVNLAAADVSEDDKIKVVMNQSSYDPMTYNKKNGGVLHANNTCYRCGNVGHQVRNCPTTGDKNFDIAPKIKKSTGIPRSFMVEVDDPNIKGAMLTSCGRYAIPTIDAQAYAIGKKEKHPFLHQDESKPEDEKVPVPKDFQCLICRDLLVDSVVIPCCGNSYCDDCIRTALLDSEDHVCPTCNQSDVSPDTLIANKSLRQAVNNFEKEKGYTRSLKENSGTPQSLTTKPAPGSTALTLQQEKNLQSTVSQQADVNESQAHCPVSLSPYIQAREKTKDLAADTPEIFLHKDTTAGVSHPTTLVNNDPALKSSIGHITPTNLQSSFYSLRTTGVASEQQHPLPPSSSSHPSVPPPLFLSHQFHLFPPGQKFLNHPSGQLMHPPNSTHPNPHVTSILPVVPTSSSSSSIRPLIQRDWFNRHRQGKERSPRPRSTYRRTSHSKSQTSRSSSRSSRSRSRSNSRSRPSSPYSRHRIQHPRTNSSRSYGCGYKRSHSPTASSSSSPRESSRSTSHSEHRKKRPNKKSSHSGYNSNRPAEKSPTSPRAEGHSGKSDAKQPTSSQDPNADYYEQWKRQYKDWYDKYFASYVSHYHQMPPPLHSLPPPPNLLWADQGDDPSNQKLPNHSTHRCSPPSQSSKDSRSSHSTHRRSPPSQSSKDSRSSRSPSSNESRSPLSRSWSDSNSPQSRSPSDTSSPPSKNATPHRGHTAKDTSLKQEYKKYEKVVPDDHSSSPCAAHKKDKLLHSEASVTVEKPLKSNKIVSGKHQRPESENKHLKTKVSYPLQQDDKSQNAKHTRKSQKVHKDTDCELYKHDRKDKDGSEEKSQQSPIKTLESSGYMKINHDIADGKFPHNPDKEQQGQPKKKLQPPNIENMWEEKSKLKPRKISININLDQKRPEEKIEKRIPSCSERSNVKEHYEKLDLKLPGPDNEKSSELNELQGSDEVQRPTEETVEGLRPRDETAEGLGPREVTTEWLGPREETTERPGPREETTEELGPREVTQEGLRKIVDPVEELEPREETQEGLRSRVDPVEEMKQREETSEGPRLRVDPVEELGPREEMSEGLRSRVDPTQELGPREETLEGLRPREETSEGLRPREETPEGLRLRVDPAEELGPREETPEGLRLRLDSAEELGLRDETPEGLRLREEMLEGLRSRVDLVEELKLREETPEGLGPREDPAEGLGPKEDPAEGLGPREDPTEGLGPREDPMEGLWPSEDPAIGLRPSGDPAGGLWCREDPAGGLGPKEEPAEGLGPREDPTEGLGPREDPMEVLWPSEDPAIGLRPSGDPAGGLWCREDPAGGLGPKEEPAEGLGPREDPTEGLGPREDPMEGLWPSEDPAIGLRPSGDPAGGLWCREDPAEGPVPREDPAEGPVPREDLAEGPVPREDLAEGLAPKEDPAEGLAPTEDPAEGLPPTEDPVEWLAPTKDPAEVLAPTEDPAEVLAPTEDPAEVLAPTEDPAEVLAPTEDPAEVLAPTEDPAEGLWPREDPAIRLWPIEDLAKGLWPREDPAEGPGPREDAAEGPGPREDPAEGPGLREDLAEGTGPTEDPAEGPGPREELAEEVMVKQALSSKETMMDDVKMKNMSDESVDYVMPHSSHKPNITVESDCSFNLASNRTFILDWIEGEDSLEKKIEVTNSLLGQKHNQDDAFELMQAPLCKFDNEDPEDDKQQVSVAPLLPPVTQGSWKPEEEAKNKRQMSDEKTTEESWERNSSLTPSSGQSEGSTAGARKDGKKGCKLEEEQKKERFESSPKHLSCSSLTVHQPDRPENEQDVSIGASEDRQSIGSNKRKKQHDIPLDVKSEKSEGAKHDYCHVVWHHNNDSKEIKYNTNVSLPSITHPSKRLRTHAEYSGSKPGSKPKRQHDSRSTVKPKPESREEMWKKYKLEKLLKESQQIQAAKEPDLEKGVDCHHKGKIHQVEGEKPSDHNGNVKTEHESMSLKHETEKRHGVVDHEVFEVQDET
ncbi:uncharacterized protein LOC144209190 [Stigmatopora nigra]